MTCGSADSADRPTFELATDPSIGDLVPSLQRGGAAGKCRARYEAIAVMMLSRFASHLVDCTLSVEFVTLCRRPFGKGQCCRHVPQDAPASAEDRSIA